MQTDFWLYCIRYRLIFIQMNTIFNISINYIIILCIGYIYIFIYTSLAILFFPVWILNLQKRHIYIYIGYIIDRVRERMFIVFQGQFYICTSFEFLCVLITIEPYNITTATASANTAFNHIHSRTISFH